MNLSLRKYFSFDYLKLLDPLFRGGVYQQDTFDDENNLIITTRFYLDGDVQNELYTLNDRLLAEYHEDKVNKHMEKLKKKILSMDAFYAQIQAIVLFATSLLSFMYTYREFGLINGAGVTAGIGTIVFFTKKYWFKALAWLFQKLIIPLIQRY
ncbi:MAG: hypothetical protein P8100_07525 [bacterium]|jgi:hypothetical protein